MSEPSEQEPGRVRNGRRIQDLCSAIARAATKRAQGKLSSIGLSSAAHSLIRVIGEREDMTLTEAAKVLRVESATLSSLAVRLERDGLLTREVSPNDKRAMFLKLTTHARNLGKQGDQIMAIEAADVTHQLSEGEQAQLVTMLERVLQNLEPTKTGG